MRKLLIELHRDEQAQTMTEYSLLVFLVALAFLGLGGPNGVLTEAIRIWTDQILFVISLPLIP